MYGCLYVCVGVWMSVCVGKCFLCICVCVCVCVYLACLCLCAVWSVGGVCGVCVCVWGVCM